MSDERTNKARVQREKKTAQKRKERKISNENPSNVSRSIAIGNAQKKLKRKGVSRKKIIVQKTSKNVTVNKTDSNKSTRIHVKAKPRVSKRPSSKKIVVNPRPVKSSKAIR